MKKIDWHKRNIDKILDETANDMSKRYIYALACAVWYILEQMKRKEEHHER